MQSKTMITNSPEDTQALATKIAQKLRGGEVIELISDLGGGKTTFTQGLVSALGSVDNVASPTFTISREYSGGKYHVYHFDFYRLQEPGIIADELNEVVGDSGGLVVIEWGDIVENVLPNVRLKIELRATSEKQREITIWFPTELAYLVEDK